MEELSLLQELALLEGMEQTEYIGGIRIIEASRDNADDLFDLSTGEKIDQTREELNAIYDRVITVVNAPDPEPFVYEGHTAKNPEYSPFVDVTESRDQTEAIPKTVISTGDMNNFPHLPPRRKKSGKRNMAAGLGRAGRPTKRKTDRPRFYDKEAY